MSEYFHHRDTRRYDERRCANPKTQLWPLSFKNLINSSLFRNPSIHRATVTQFLHSYLCQLFGRHDVG